MAIRGWMAVLITAMQRMFYKLVAILQQIRPELPARARQVMQGVEVELPGELSDDTGTMTVVSTCRAAESCPCCRFRLTDSSSGRR